MMLKPLEYSDMEKNHFIMYKNYIKELREIGGLEYYSTEADFILKNVKDRLNNEENTVFFDIDNGKGFILFGFGDNCHPYCDYYIEECFIAPEYRRKGLMKQAIKELFNKNKGIYCLYILKNNTTALSFWNKIGKLKAVDDEYNDLENCQQYFITVR